MNRKNASKEKVVHEVRKICIQGCTQKIFSAVAAGVCLDKGHEKYSRVYTHGKTNYTFAANQVNTHTLFDLASLTKPLCTALCIMHLVAEKRLTLYTPLADLYPHCNPVTGTILIGHLLSHCSGLPAYKTYFTEYRPPFSHLQITTSLIESILSEKLENKPGQVTVYSDLGYIVLGDIIEKVSGVKLERYFQWKVTDPLSISDSLFFLTASAQPKAAEVVATEQCTWRKRLLQGEVHDEHCSLMGGVAGHAGLFGNIKGVMKLVEEMLFAWIGKQHSPALAGSQFSSLFQTWYRGSPRYLGFDRPTPGISSSGTYFSPESAGHLGFTGTSFWMDPVKKIAVVLLTNRVHPSRTNEKIRQFRPLFHNRIMEIVGCL
ncbi:MAG: hypothetical protein CSA33_05040 [Desulfobulbus propionicus]|nr:MAG: hypothetical protein CSA33_05040 [Desulfobulbus propionicus]